MVYGGVVSTILPLLFLILSDKAYHKIWWALLYICIFWLASDLTTLVFSYYELNTFLVFNLFDIGSTVLLINLYWYAFEGNVIRSKLVHLSIFYVLSTTLVYSFFGGWFKPNPVCSFLTMLTPIFLSVYYFYSLLSEAEVKNLYKFYFFWINSAVLIHYGMSFFVNTFIHVFFMNQNVTMSLWPILMISNMIFNVTLTIGIWRMRRT